MKKLVILSITALLSSTAMADNVDNMQLILAQKNTSFEALFPNIGNQACTGSQIYTLDGLKAAMRLFPDFLNSPDQQVNARELAAFFSNIAHETTGGWSTAPGGPYAWGLCFSHEVGCTNTSCTQYCDPNNTVYPCAAQKSYYGRGPLQLSYNYNYGLARDELRKIDPKTPDLLANPEMIEQDATTAWATALWFWMTAQSPKPSAHEAITAAPGTFINQDTTHPAGFGLTIDIINGGVECNQDANAEEQNRVDHYEKWFGPALGLQSTDYQYDSCKKIPPFQMPHK